MNTTTSSFKKQVRKRELDYTIRASELGIAPKLLSYSQLDEQLYSITMEKLDITVYDAKTITMSEFESIMALYDKLIENDIYFIDVHEENVMFKITETGGKKPYFIDYCPCYTKQQIMDDPKLIDDWLDTESSNGEEAIASLYSDTYRYLKQFVSS